MDKQLLGDIGENIASVYLKKCGYRILIRNFRFKRAEIDIICRKDNWIVFVEVKTRSSSSFGYPEEQVSHAQASRILDAADEYAEKERINALRRFDIISIMWHGKGYSLRHLQDAFY